MDDEKIYTVFFDALLCFRSSCGGSSGVPRDSNTGNTGNTSADSNMTLIIGIAAGAVVLIAAAVVVLLLLKKKKTA